MSLDLSFSDEQTALAGTVRALCAAHRPATGDDARFAVPDARWSELGSLGLLGLTTPEVGGGALDLVVVHGELGRAGWVGPLIGTVLASSVLEPDDRAAVVAGDAIVSVGDADLLPWGAIATCFVRLVDGHAWTARPVGDVIPCATMAGEPWARGTLELVDDLGPAEGAIALANLAAAAYLAGAADHLLELATTYARDRRQFGQPIGSFQAVAHPLADRALAIHAATTLTKIAANALDGSDPDGSALCASARLSAARAALDTAFVVHQTLGAIGYTTEMGAGAMTLRIRQVSLTPPSLAAARSEVLAGRGL
ncbi:MAG: acyl-CoA dehydrogenase, C-terminal [Actinomycetia bacterium]|nr:acyl-CoA dehydrogenase, C-terminal [Actinomycetes bacterium]